tara:strand:+ start:12896 stop:13009 length:114 start_codon:yes stop_codon:yes gene_type:complete
MGSRNDDGPYRKCGFKNVETMNVPEKGLLKKGNKKIL